MGAIARFTLVGPAAVQRTRAAGLLDGLAATVIAMIAVPQPIFRELATSSVSGARGIALFVMLMLGSVLGVLWLYLAFTAVTWGRSPGMYVLDLGLDAPTKPTVREAAGWAAGWALALVPAALGISRVYHPETGLPARLGGMPTRAALPVEPHN